MKRFLLNALLFALILLVIGAALDWVVTSGLRQSRLSDYSEWNDIVDGQAAADILIQGSSRAWTSLSPQIISQRVGLSCYNLGFNGYTVDMQLARYHVYREHDQKPKVIVQALDAYGLNTRDGIYTADQFLPYFDEPVLVDSLAQYHYFAWFDRYLPLVLYRGEDRTAYQGAMEFAGLRSYTTAKVKGYQGQDKLWDPKELADFVAQHPNGVAYGYNSIVERQFDDFLSRCRQEGIFVVLVYPPEYIEAQRLTTNRAELLGIYRNLAAKYGFPLLDYSGDPLSRSTAYFYNSQHMNRQGAELFSAEFAASLAGLLKEKGIAAPGAGAPAPAA